MPHIHNPQSYGVVPLLWDEWQWVSLSLTARHGTLLGTGATSWLYLALPIIGTVLGGPNISPEPAGLGLRVNHCLRTWQ